MMPTMRPLGQSRAPALGVHVVLHQAGKAGLGDAEADRAGGEIDVGLVLGARGVGLGAAEGAEILQLVEALVAEQVLDGMEHRAGVRLDGHPVLGPQDMEIERGHQRDERGRGGLVPAHLQAVAAIDLVVGVVDHVARQPEHLALELAQHVERRGRLPRQHARTFHQAPRGSDVSPSGRRPAAATAAAASDSRPASSRTSKRNMRQGTPSCSCSQSRRRPAPITAVDGLAHGVDPLHRPGVAAAARSRRHSRAGRRARGAHAGSRARTVRASRRRV